MSDTPLLNAAANGAAADLSSVADAWFSIGSDATTQASNERLQPTYGAASGGVADLSATLSFTGTGSASVSHLLVHDASTAGSIRFARPLSGDLAFNAAGDLDLTSAAITVT